MNLLVVFIAFCCALVSTPVQSKTCSIFEPISCTEILEKLDWIKIDLETRCSQLQECIDSAEQKVDALSTPTCNQAIPINQAFMNMPQPQITQAGVYCLTETVTGSLLIDADNVTINFNSFSIADGNNLISSANHTNLAFFGHGSLKNGTVGINLSGCSTVGITDICFEDNGSACVLDSTNGFVIDSCTMFGQTSFGLNFLGGTKNGKIAWCSFFNNNVTSAISCSSCESLLFDAVTVNTNDLVFGFNIDDCQNCLLNRCQVNNNQTTSIAIGVSLANSRECACIDSSVNGNSGIFFVGYSDNDSTNTLFSNCQALNNNSRAGFQIQGIATCAIHCVAKNNSERGFQARSSSDCYLFNNQSIGNFTEGFFWDGINNTVFLRNYADGNGTNYLGVPTITRFDTSVGEFRDPLNNCIAVSPSDWDNISVEPCVQP